MTALLSVDQLTFTYETAKKSAVDAVSFEIHANSVTTILGPNGAGKTTLLHLLLGLIRPASGAISLNSKALTAYSRRELAQWIGLVPQSEHVPFEYTVLEYVLLGRAPYLDALAMPDDHDAEIALQSLETVGIASLRDRSVLTLSGGESQLVTLARVLCQQPKMLLLDEPTSHLDLANRNNTLRVLDQLRQSGKTVIFTTHDPEAASLIADNIVLMRDARVLDAGSLDDTFTNEKLSRTYGTPVEVIQLDGLRVVKSLEPFR